MLLWILLWLVGILVYVASLNASELIPETERWGLRVAVTQYRDSEAFRKLKSRFVQAVQQAFGRDRDIVFQTLSDAELKAQFKGGNVDIFLANSSVFYELAASGAEFVSTAASSASVFHDPRSGVANTIFVKANRTAIEDLSFLQDKVVAICNPAYTMDIEPFLGEIATLGYEPGTFLKRMHYAGDDCNSVVRAVLEERVDAGVLPAEIFHTWVGCVPELASAVRVLNPKTDDDFKYVHSTAVYPNWTVGIVRQAGSEMVNVLLAALYANNADGIFWSVGTDFAAIDALQRRLKIGRYEYLRYWTVERLWNEYGFILTLGGVVFFGVLCFALFMNRLVKIRTRQLTDALLAQDEFRQKTALSYARLRLFERMSILNQVSSILAHELRQPLNAIKCYAYGLNRRLDDENTDLAVLSCVRQIEEKANIANEIIRKVRSFSLRGRVMQDVDLRTVIGTTVSHYLVSGKRMEEVTWTCPDGLVIHADPYEIELVMLNLMNNASEALRKIANSKIAIVATAHGPRPGC